MQQNGHTIIFAGHIDDFVIACADRATLDKFRARLLDVFDGTYEGAFHTYIPPPDRAFYLRYRGIVGSLGYLVNMIRPDLAFPYSELSK